jgi:signal transduction histidine kinase
MIVTMNNWWNRISNLGVNESMRSSKQVGVIMLNRMTIIGLLVEIMIYLKQYFVNGIWLNPPTFVLVPMTLGVFLFHYYQRFYEARLYVNIVFPALMAFIVCYYGAPLRTEYTFFIFVTTAVVFFRSIWQRILLICYNIVLFLLSYFYAITYPSPRIAQITNTEPVTLFIASVLCISILIAAYINEIRRKEKQLEALLANLKGKNEDLLSAYQEIERFAYITSHDLKTPLRNISSFIGLLERKLHNGQYDQVDEYLKFIKEGSQRMHSLIQDSLEYARVERLDNEPHQSIDLQELVQEIAQELRPIYAKKIDLYTNALPVITGRRLHLHMLLQNLLENGAKYNDKAVIELSVIYTPTANGIALDIQDNGIGIAPDFQQQVFEIFKRLHTERDYPGTGIGLSICKKIVEKMGGSIALASTPGQGSTFTLQLPLPIENSITPPLAISPF